MEAADEHMHAAPFVQEADTCARCLHKWNCAHGCSPTTHAEPSPLPPPLRKAGKVGELALEVFWFT